MTETHSKLGESFRKPVQILGPTRNVTGVFLKFRSDFKSRRNRFGYSLLQEERVEKRSYGRSMLQKDGVSNHLLGAGESVEMGVMTSGPPLWTTCVERIKHQISQTKETLTQLQKMQQRRLMLVVDTEETERVENEIISLSSSLTRLLASSERDVRDLDKLVSEGSHEIISNVQKSLALLLTAITTEFRSSQKQYLSDLSRRDEDANGYPNAGGGSSDSIGASISNVLEGAFTDDQLLLMMEDDLEDRIEHRSSEISKIARSVNELNLVFKDLANLVVEQGTVLDRIDYNMENIVRHTEDANDELMKAERMQKSARAQKCIYALLLFIFANVLLLFWRAP